MNKKLLSFLSFTLLSVLLMGCYSTLDGRTKMGTPAGLKKDRVVSKYERTIDEIREATRKVLEFNGTLTGDDRVSNIITGIVDTRTVQVRLDELENGVTRVIVQARTKNGGTDVETAAEIDKQIALNLPRI